MEHGSCGIQFTLLRFRINMTTAPTGTIYCEFTGEVSQAFRALGWDMWSVDYQASECPHPQHAREDANDFVIGALHDKFAGVHWPCTYFANSSVKWMYGGKGTVIDPERMRRMKQSAEGLVMLLQTLEAFKIPFYFENPIMHGMARDYIASRFSWFAKATRQIVQPWNFGVWETKATCLWLHNLPSLAVKYHTVNECRIALDLPLYVEVDGKSVLNKPRAACHLASPGPNRGNDRSRTLPPLANAMASQWSAYLLSQ